MEFIDLKTQQSRIRAQIEAAIVRVLDHGQYIMGPEVEELEDRLISYVGVKHSISCASGTDALLIALMALDIGPGDEVITVPYTWISTAEVIALLRAKPVFVDIEPETFNLDPEKLEAAITPRTRAIMPVHIYGMPCEMDAILANGRKHKLAVIEDACQAWLAEYHGQKCGTLGDVGCFSFQQSKHIPSGEGGAITSMSETLIDRCNSYQNCGRTVGTNQSSG